MSLLDIYSIKQFFKSFFAIAARKRKMKQFIGKTSIDREDKISFINNLRFLQDFDLQDQPLGTSVHLDI